MKCLSVKQPWASLIASGRKTIELRTWSTTYRGPILICSGQTPERRFRREAKLKKIDFELGPLGVSICVVDLIDIRSPVRGDNILACHDTRGALCWILANPRTIPAVPHKGQLKLYDATEDFLREIVAREFISTPAQW